MDKDCKAILNGIQTSLDRIEASQIRQWTKIDEHTKEISHIEGYTKGVVISCTILTVLISGICLGLKFT